MHPFDPTSTQLRPLGEYSERLPSSRRGKRINRATLWRWALKGMRGGIVLRTDVLGGCRYTCDAYVAEFIRQLSAAPLPPPAVCVTSGRSRAEIEQHLRMRGNRPGVSTRRV